MTQSLIALIEAAKDPLEDIERKYPDGLTGNSATNFNAGINKAIEIIRQHETQKSDQWSTPAGDPIFGEGSLHDIRKHIDEIVASPDTDTLIERSQGEQIAYDAIHEGMTEWEIAKAIDDAIKETRLGVVIDEVVSLEEIERMINDMKDTPLIMERISGLIAREKRRCAKAVSSEITVDKPFERYEEVWELAKGIVTKQGHYSNGEPDYLTDAHVVYNEVSDFILSLPKRESRTFDDADYQAIGAATHNAMIEFHSDPKHPHYTRHIGKAVMEALSDIEDGSQP